jgi:hypothetical protein
MPKPWLYGDLAKDVDSLQICRTGLSFHLKFSHPLTLTAEDTNDLEVPLRWPRNWDVGCLPLLKKLFPHLLKLQELGHKVAVYIPRVVHSGYLGFTLEGFIPEGVDFSEESFRSGRLKVSFELTDFV